MSANLQQQIEEPVSDRQKFNEFVYTPVEEAIRQLSIRKSDPNLSKWVDEHVHYTPDMLCGDQKAIFHRQLITPNYEISRFISIIDALDLDPVFFEYHQDKYVTESEWKYFLGKLCFYKGKGKKGGIKLDSLNIIDLNKSNGKKIDEVKTLWNQSLIDFHHEMFLGRFPAYQGNIYDGSEWYANNGQNAQNYYFPFLTLVLQHSILFENFMLDSKEISFTKEVFLPASIKVLNESGHKPLIVALEPTDIEGDHFWLCHPPESMDFVKGKLNLLK